MVNILVMTHGEMAPGMYQTAGMILGEQSDFAYLTFSMEQSLDTLVSNLKEKLDSFGNDNPYIVLIDLFGGSPANAAVQLLAEGYEMQAVTGVNLPMLIAALTGRDVYSFEELVEQIVLGGTDGVVDIVKKLSE